MKLTQSLERAKNTSQAITKVGFIGQVVIKSGIVARFAKQDVKPDTFVSYEEGVSDDDILKRAQELAEKATERADVMPCIWFECVPDTSITPTSRFRRSFISLDTNAPRGGVAKLHGHFLARYASPEIDDNLGKKIWVHIQWVRLTEEFGGDLKLTGDDAGNELAMLVTYIPNKKEATELLKGLQSGTISLDALAEQRGYDIAGMRRVMAANYANAATTNSDPNKVMLTETGTLTSQNYSGGVAQIYGDDVATFFRETLKTSGSVDEAATICGVEPGDLAFVLEDKAYFEAKVAATGKPVLEVYADIAKETGLANASDLARLLNIEIPF